MGRPGAAGTGRRAGGEVGRCDCDAPRVTTRRGLLGMLTGRYRLSRREARLAVAELFGWKALFSLGMVMKTERRTSEALARAYEDAVLAVQSAPFVHTDETGWREGRKKACLWTFARVDGVGPTNNEAERTLRKAVLWRTCSFGSASADGSRLVERMLTVCESLRAQGRSILDFLEESIRAGLCGQPQPSLLPARAA